MKERGKIANIPLKVQYILLDFANYALRFKFIKNIILFGSYSKLIFSEKSDIDIAVVFSNRIRNRAGVEKKLMALEEKLSRKYKKKIQMHFFLEGDLKHKEDPLIRDILRNGVVLV